MKTEKTAKIKPFLNKFNKVGKNYPSEIDYNLQKT